MSVTTILPPSFTTMNRILLPGGLASNALSLAVNTTVMPGMSMCMMWPCLMVTFCPPPDRPFHLAIGRGRRRHVHLAVIHGGLCKSCSSAEAMPMAMRRDGENLFDCIHVYSMCVQLKAWDEPSFWTSRTL